MSDLRYSTHFLGVDVLPEFDASTPFRDLYSELSRSDSNDFLVVSPDGRRRYVKGTGLAEAATRVSVDDKSTEHLRGLSMEPIGRIIDKPWAMTQVLVPEEPVDVNTDAKVLQETNVDKVVPVKKDGRQVGWFLNHETVRNTATGKTVWICENGHENPDQDHGTCYSCPGDIVRAKHVRESSQV